MDIDTTSGVFELTRETGACEVQICRARGPLEVCGLAQDFAFAGDTVQAAELEIPETPAGLGISIDETDDGIGIVAVHPGTAAYEAGLEAGDVIVSVDGEPAAHMSLGEFVGIAVGEAGSTAEIEVLGIDGATRRYEISRKVVE